MKKNSLIVILLISVLTWTGCNANFSPVNENVSNEPIFIIDAGHGGVDGGAVSNDGLTEEKELNLQIAFKVRDFLQLFGYKTYMIRTEDISIHDPDANTIREKKVSDIHNRLKILESYENSILISIHQNKFEESKYSGTQVFYSPNNPESAVLAEEIQTSVRNLLQNSNSRMIKKSGSAIYLLYNATKPAILVECGFLSNAEETKLLKNEDYQQQLSFAILSGIINYLNNSEDIV